jgi:mannose-1-phosphate guanylyltransferase
MNKTSIPVQPVVMAGGSGTRLWPLSRAAYPKQFLVLTADNRSLYQQAVQRLQQLAAAPVDIASWHSTSCANSASPSATCCSSRQAATPRRR